MSLPYEAREAFTELTRYLKGRNQRENKLQDLKLRKLRAETEALEFSLAAMKELEKDMMP